MITTKTNLNQSNKTEKFEKKNHLNSIWFVWVDPFLTSFSFWSKQSNIPYKLSLSFLGISLTDMIRRCPSSKLHYWSRINDGLKLLIFNQMGPPKANSNLRIQQYFSSFHGLTVWWNLWIFYTQNWSWSTINPLKLQYFWGMISRRVHWSRTSHFHSRKHQVSMMIGDLENIRW